MSIEVVRLAINLDKLGGIHSVEAWANDEDQVVSVKRKWGDMNPVEKSAVYGAALGLYPILKRGGIRSVRQ